MKQKKISLWAAFAWLAIWQTASFAAKSIFFASPVQVAARLFALAKTAAFWQSVAFSLGRIGAGFALGVFFAVFFAAASSKFKRFEEFLSPAMAAFRTVPVISFIILALICFSPKNLSALISFLMVLPMIYVSSLEGIRAADPKMLEMAKVFRFSRAAKIRTVIAPAAAPFFMAGCKSALGLCWKAGIAAEAIGAPQGSIGEQIRMSKIYLETADLFAWTAVVLAASAAFEKAASALLEFSIKKIEEVRL